MFVLQMRLKPQQPLLTGNKQTWIESAGIYFLETALQNNARLHGLWGSSLSFYTPPGMFKGLSEFPRTDTELPTMQWSTQDTPKSSAENDKQSNFTASVLL